MKNVYTEKIRYTIYDKESGKNGFRIENKF